MKATVLFVSIMALCLLVIPMIALNYETVPADVHTETPVHAPAAPLPSVPEPPEEDSYALDEDNPEDSAYAGEEAFLPVSGVDIAESFLILDETTGKVNEVPLRDFIRGAVAAEMPASFHSEALKAQAVAAHTFALHNRLIRLENPDPGLKGADFSADPSNMKVYMTEATALEFYGDDAELYWGKICDAADSVMDYVLEYEDEPIVAAYHAISSGMTEDAANVWIGSAPYLMPVKSAGDLEAPGFESSVTFTVDEVKSKLKEEYPDISLDGAASGWFGEPVRSGSGYVTEITAGDMPLHGKDIRRIFDLRSHNFEIACDGDEFVFTVTGYGHGVGLSQYGANYLANQDLSFEEILDTYYTGAVLKKLEH